MKAHDLGKKIVIFLLCCLQLVPLYITIAVAIKPQTDVSSYWELPNSPHLQNFLTAFRAGDLLNAYKNTFIISVSATLAVLVLSVMAAYPLARYPSRFNI